MKSVDLLIEKELALAVVVFVLEVCFFDETSLNEVERSEDVN